VLVLLRPRPALVPMGWARGRRNPSMRWTQEQLAYMRRQYELWRKPNYAAITDRMNEGVVVPDAQQPEPRQVRGWFFAERSRRRKLAQERAQPAQPVQPAADDDESSSSSSGSSSEESEEE
jgi:hypothetical protein